MDMKPQFIDVRKFQEGLSSLVGQAMSIKSVAKNWKDCKDFVFRPKNKHDIERIVKYFRDRDTDLLATMPQEILKEAK
jgi:hypothetical protein